MANHMQNPEAEGVSSMSPPRDDNARSGVTFAPITNDSSDNASGSGDDGDSSEEEDELGAEDAQSVLGVSIGQAQSHFTSPNTPAAEKAAMMEQIEGGGLFDKYQPPDPEPTQTREALIQRPRKRESSIPQIRFPSPWRAGPKTFQRNEETRAPLRDAFGGHRRRASWGSNAQETIRRMFPNFNLPSLPKSPNLSWSLPSLNYSGTFDLKRDTVPFQARKKSNTVSIPQFDGFGLGRPIRQPPASTLAQNAPVDATHRPMSGGQQPKTVIQRPIALDPSNRRSTTLRRSASDNSLILYRSLSRASSLGDDSRFEHVQEQVNSRLKAIKDSLQDSNFRFPSIPSMPTFGSFKPDEISSRSSALLREFQAFDAFRATSPRWPSTSRSPSMGTSRQRSSSNVPSHSEPPGAMASASVSAPASASSHPFFNRALEDLTGDLVVMGGYRGSILRSADFPNRQLWVPFKVGLNLRKVDLEVGLNPEDEENMERTIIPGGMLSHIGPVDISRRLLKRLRHSQNARKGLLRVHEYSYDWRLNPNLLSRKLQEFMKKLPCNQPQTPASHRGAIVIAHSLGGLITRHAINHQPDLFRGVVYAGTPQHCVNILGPLRNGDDVLLSSRVLTAQVNFTIRTSFALLPLEGKCFFDKQTKEEYPVDFFDPKTWVDNCLSPCVSTPLPSLNELPSSGIGGLIGSVTTSLSMLGRKGSVSRSSSTRQPITGWNETGQRDGGRVRNVADGLHPAEAIAEDRGVVPQMGGQNHHLSPPAMSSYSTSPTSDYHPSTKASTPATTCTLSREEALEYLTRVLAEVKDFKEKLAYEPSHSKSNRYPPAAVIYGKSIPTVYGARVVGREGIRHADAYDDLAFASGDGVVLARAAMVPEGYQAVRGGVVSSDRGHIGLLGDLEAVGRCLTAVMGARQRGVGVGTTDETKSNEIKH